MQAGWYIYAGVMSVIALAAVLWTWRESNPHKYC
ncbi:MAG: hypothetical protein KHY08_10280 [Lachnospiraceae bacterium]|nr:hypothetical protein [Lachnospiraceae bacterium]